MKSTDFLNVLKYSTGKLKISSQNGKIAIGKLTIMGNTSDITFPITKSSGKYVSKISFYKFKFGIIFGPGSFSKNLGDKVFHGSKLWEC